MHLSPLHRIALFCAVGAFTVGLLFPGTASAQVTPDQQAEMLLTAARRAYNEKNHPFAIEKFREFQAKFGNHKEANAARYELALALLDGPHDYNAAVEQLTPLAGNKEFPQHAFVLYHLGLAKRGQGVKELAEAVAKPNEAGQRQANAKQRFEEAAQNYAAAVPVFTAKAKEPAADTKELPVEWEWAARARCDLAEMQLRTQKVKEAQATAEPFVKEAVLVKSRYRGLGLYYHGSACFLQKDYLAAGRSLNQLTPFTDPIFGTHARYLVARVHHLQDERAEAMADYDAVAADYAKQKAAAIEALKQPDKFKNDPDEKVRLEALVKDAPPDHVARAVFYLGTMQYEDGKFAEASTKLGEFIKQFANSPLAAEAQLRQGFCQVQLKTYPEAQKTLQPLVDKYPSLADQALLWIAKSQVGAADPNNAPQYEQALKASLDTFRRAAEKAQALSNSDADAKARKGEILIEMGDTQQLLRQYKEAAATYNQVVSDKLLPARDEEATQRQATALHLAGDYIESDKVCARFVQTYLKSTLLPAVQFRAAENAYFTALAAEKNPNLPNRATELPKLFDEAAKRYQVVVEKYPEFAHANLARYGLALTYYRKGDLEKTQASLEKIPPPDRVGDLALVPYLQADCLIRLAPAKADDALAAGKMEEQLKAAAEMLDGFIAAQPNGSQTPDALLKLGFCHTRLAALFTQKEDQVKAYAAARAAYEKLMNQFAKHEIFPQGLFEWAKCLAQQGDIAGAFKQLSRFRDDPALKAASIAPMAQVHWATLLRGQNKAGDAAEVLNKARQDHEANLAKDPARAGWIAVLRYHHGLALKESGKLGDARAAFDLVVKQSSGAPESAEAALRFGQCLKDEGMLKIGAARKRLATPNLKPEEIASANKDLDAGMKDVRDAIAYLDTQAEEVKKKDPASEARARMFYDAAWGSRALAEIEIAAARSKIQQELWQKLKDEAAKKTPPGKTAPVVPMPEVPLTAVPVQPSETKARGEYQGMIASFPDLALSGDARFELAELLAERNEMDAAVKLLKETLDKEPAKELSDKVRIRLGACLDAKGDPKAALAQFLAVAQDPKSPLAGQAYYRAGECQIQRGEWAEAVKHLAVFRDQGPFQNLPGLTDRALLRLGFALGKQSQWDQSRQAYEQVVNRFGNGPWVHEARYGIGWAWQNQKQYDNAVNAYSQVASATATEIGARAQLQVGLCRLEQKKHPEAISALLVVPYTFDYPELSASALCEAARGMIESNQKAQATRLLERVIKDHPDSKWAEVAKERLEALKKG
jgi:tetratricopeptide (TPR) repeat protein